MFQSNKKCVLLDERDKNIVLVKIINPSSSFLDPQQSNCPSGLDVAPRDYPTISNPLGLFANISSSKLCH